MPLFEWDEKKARQNKAKHKVSFELAQRVFEDPFQLNDFDRTVKGEDRYKTLGVVGTVVLLVAHCFRKNKDGEEVIRIISARKATTRERGEYERRAGR